MVLAALQTNDRFHTDFCTSLALGTTNALALGTTNARSSSNRLPFPCCFRAIMARSRPLKHKLTKNTSYPPSPLQLSESDVHSCVHTTNINTWFLFQAEVIDCTAQWALCWQNTVLLIINVTTLTTWHTLYYQVRPKLVGIRIFPQKGIN